MEPNQPPGREPRSAATGWMRWTRWLRVIPGIGRLRSLRPGTGAHVGVLVDAFAAFATLDDELSTMEADLVLDLLRSAFPDVDHGWLARRLQRAVRNPTPLHTIAGEMKNFLNDTGKLAVGLQLFTLVDAAGRSERSRASFERFMRRLGRPDYGLAILREMRGTEFADQPPFDRLVFGGEGADVVLPPAARDHSFRVYRTGDLLLVRNMGPAPLWIRGRSLEPGAFLRMRERQPLVIPGWTLTHEDLVFFLDVGRTENPPSIFIEAHDEGFTAERTRSRQSLVRVRFGLNAEVEAFRDTTLHAGSRGALTKGDVIHCHNHERLSDDKGFSVSIDDLRRRAIHAGRRFRLASDRQEYLVSNDPTALSRGDLLLGPKLAPRVVMFIRFDEQRAEGMLELRESEGPVFVDGIPVRGNAPLNDGSLIRLSGSQAVRCRFSEGFLDEERTQIESLVAEDVIHDFGPGSRALDNISFDIRRGEMLCIIGPSGSGKSTLLSVLSGQLEPTRGHIRMNGIDLYEHRERLVPFVAHMPQEEALNPQLTVREHLRHATTVRRPALSLAEHERRVDSVLAELGLQPIARRRVGSPGEKTLSGGERSRLNLGLDLGSRAEIFLFDEPISGLSSKDSEHVAETLRSLARDKIVIASLHRPGATVLRLFDKVLLLDSGGRIAFFGTPQAMVTYFREACDELAISHPSVIARTPLGADFVFDVLETPLSAIGGGLNPVAARRFPPSFWQERFESLSLVKSLAPGESSPPRLGDTPSPELLPVPPKPARRFQSLVALFATHFQRSLLSKFRNRGTLYSTFLEAPLLAMLIGITLRSSPKGSYEFDTALHIPAYLFLSATVAMFLGLTNSATEILRDRPLLRRERNCQPGAGLYIAAKLCALGLVAAAQCLAYLVIANPILGIRGMLLDHWFWLTLTAWTGTGLALVVSALVKTERAALTSVPLLLVPQMLLAGALVPYREMNRGLFWTAPPPAGTEQTAGKSGGDASAEKYSTRERGGAPVPAMFMPLRHSYEALVVDQATRNPFEFERYRLQRRVEIMKDFDQSLPNDVADRFDLMKEGLRRLLAAGARNPEEAADLLARITRLARSGTRLEVQNMKVWPDDDAGVRPASEFFVNERIDLLVREAETFRNDYRNKSDRNVFLALKKPVFGTLVDTLEFSALLQLLIVLGCGTTASLILAAQNRRTR
ncbi:ATP-binding cassette domain-containing protein [Luteolibacter ambystomatis]|uniref:ATP-binding cassette domain-containing protein n=1 Tax=Luteolibacter ambystomatis TaxID=2824561 RepID=A0A975IZH2_9BACT|nr:ATP-binding cassette domain-containing protein [Luteolibacter ambystomatis]QUE51302.1 ATP-binding cassette domain-containing protein [Luteolibacter ambystomatis]